MQVLQLQATGVSIVITQLISQIHLFLKINHCKGESRLFCEPHSSELEWFDRLSSSSEFAFFNLRLAFANHVDT